MSDELDQARQRYQSDRERVDRQAADAFDALYPRSSGTLRAVVVAACFEDGEDGEAPPYGYAMGIVDPRNPNLSPTVVATLIDATRNAVLSDATPELDLGALRNVSEQEQEVSDLVAEMAPDTRRILRMILDAADAQETDDGDS